MGHVTEPNWGFSSDEEVVESLFRADLVDCRLAFLLIDIIDSLIENLGDEIPAVRLDVPVILDEVRGLCRSSLLPRNPR